MLYIEGKEANGMTIKELENILGMTRANIRFYEQEGFITPARGGNNYRIYSWEDADTLKKIKLLRQLGLPLDTIKQMQQGELELDVALARQQRTLEEQRAELEWAGRVCTAMRDDKAEYATLDAGKYLNALDRPAEGEGYFSLNKDSAPMAPYPWRRFFARWLDLFLYSALWSAFGMLVLRFNPPDGLFFTLLGSYLNYGTMLVVEPLLLSTWGYTPGKWIFGLQVRDRSGGKLYWTEAMSRTWQLFAKGEGYGIPIYNLYRYYKSYRACSDCEFLPWEEEYGCPVIKDLRARRCWGFVGAAVALFVLTFFAVAQAQMPRHRGMLTPEQYTANVNDLYRYITRSSDQVMDANGQWEEKDNVVYLLGNGSPDHQLTLNEEGKVTAVTLTRDLAGKQAITSDDTFDKQLAALSFVAAVGDYNCISWLNSGVLTAISEGGFEDYTIQTGEVTITQTVFQNGYQDAGGWLFGDESVPENQRQYQMEFTIALQP